MRSLGAATAGSARSPDGRHEPDVVTDGLRAQEGRPGGTGIGLTVARELIEANGGRLTIESSTPAGTTLRIDLLWGRQQVIEGSEGVAWLGGRPKPAHGRLRRDRKLV